MTLRVSSKQGFWRAGRDSMNMASQVDFGTPAVSTDKKVQVEIDGISTTVNAGTSIMRAGRETGVDIPKLCATDSVKAFGSCRMCQTAGNNSWVRVARSGPGREDVTTKVHS